MHEVFTQARQPIEVLPMDRLLRFMFETDIWSCPVELKRSYQTLLDTPTEEWNMGSDEKNRGGLTLVETTEPPAPPPEAFVQTSELSLDPDSLEYFVRTFGDREGQDLYIEHLLWGAQHSK